MNIGKEKIFYLMGPTASGKTVLAIELAKKLPFEVISVDSAMVYKGMDIGTAKPTKEEMQGVPHHLIDVCDPLDLYSVGQFREDVLAKIKEIFSRDKIPLLAGGTMMYFKVLQYGISDLPKSDEEVRAKIEEEKSKVGLEGLLERLKRIDPKMAERLKPGDSQRIQRALEVCEMTGKTLSELQEISPPKKIPYEGVRMVLSPKNIEIIRERIRVRFKDMLDQGFIEEVEGLRNRGDLHLGLPSMKTVGYRQIWQYLSGEISKERMLELVPIITGQLAKRQLTWLRRWDDVAWFDSDAPLRVILENLIKVAIH